MHLQPHATGCDAVQRPGGPTDRFGKTKPPARAGSGGGPAARVPECPLRLSANVPGCPLFRESREQTHFTSMPCGAPATPARAAAHVLRDGRFPPAKGGVRQDQANGRGTKPNEAISNRPKTALAHRKCGFAPSARRAPLRNEPNSHGLDQMTWRPGTAAPCHAVVRAPIPSWNALHRSFTRSICAPTALSFFSIISYPRSMW